MHVTNGKQNLTDVEHTNIIAKPSILSQPIEKFSTSTIFENHVNKNVILESCFQRVNKRMIQLSKNFFLKFDVFDLFQVDYMWFWNLF